MPGRPETDADSDDGDGNDNDNDNVNNNENDNDNDGDVAAADNVVEPVVVPDGEVEPGVSRQCSMSGLGADAPMAVDPEAMDVRDNELNELDSQPLLVSGSGGAEERVLDPSPSQGSASVLGGAGERVLDPSPSDSILGASTGQSGESQEEVMESSPTFSPLSGSVLSVAPSSESVSEVGVDSGDDAPASVVESGPLRSKIPVKVGRSVSGGLHPPLVSREETANMVQKLKASLPSSKDDLAASAFIVPNLPPRVSSRSSGSGMALRPSSRSRSRSGDERAPPSPLSPDPHRSRRRTSSPSPARRR